MVECPHGVISGHVIRPTSGTPPCALCRRSDPATWVKPNVGAYDPPPPRLPMHVTAHGIQVCQFGIVHAKCGCGNPTEHEIPCDQPDKHAPHGHERAIKRPRNA